MKSEEVKTVAIIQARMGSTRLPEKVLKDLAGQTVLERVINRAFRAKVLNTVVVATTTKPSDDAIIRLCQEKDWRYFRGSEEDVLDRYYKAALENEADVVVRITSDCPLIEPKIIEQLVAEFMSHYSEVAYVSNTRARTFPLGLDAEVMSFHALERAWNEDDNPAWREHVTPYILRHPEKFRIRDVTAESDYSYMRWTVDTAEDLAFVRKIYDHFPDDTFSWEDVLRVLEMNPDWLKINQHVQQKVLP
ncbi:cytidylyltransferase domain-containing protein [Chloroflexota bacterium]